jgi:hypothetical protein
MSSDNSTAGEHSGASHCSHYIPLMAIPSGVHEAAQTLHNYFEKQGMREWEFSAVADRRLVTKLERERDELRKELEEYRSIAENIGAKKAVSEKEKAIKERDEAREALQLVLDWAPLPPDYLDKKSKAQFEADFAEARKALEAAK